MRSEEKQHTDKAAEPTSMAVGPTAAALPRRTVAVPQALTTGLGSSEVR